MAGLVPAIHVFLAGDKDVDARHKAGHDAAQSGEAALMAVRRLAPAEVQPKEFAFTAANAAWAENEIKKYPEGRRASAVIPLLWRAQEQHGGWLPEPAIRYVADMLDMAHIRALEVATFYTMFQLEPVGQFLVQLCGTTPCMLRGSEELKKVCHRRIGDQHHVTADGKFSWVEVECLAACVNAPMVQINADYYEDLTPESFEKILDDLVAGKTPKAGPQIDRQFSAPVGGLTTLTDPAIFATAPRSGGPALADTNAKKPGEAANLRDAGVPKPPVADSSDQRRG